MAKKQSQDKTTEVKDVSVKEINQSVDIKVSELASIAADEVNYLVQRQLYIRLFNGVTNPLNYDPDKANPIADLYVGPYNAITWTYGSLLLKGKDVIRLSVDRLLDEFIVVNKVMQLFYADLEILCPDAPIEDALTEEEFIQLSLNEGSVKIQGR